MGPDMSEPDVNARIEDDEAETGRLRRDLNEARQQGVRLLADFENLRRRAGREQGLARQQGKCEVLRALLPVLDAFDRALEMGSTDPRFYEGMAATHRLFVEAFRQVGAEPIASEGEPFDPTLHEAGSVADGPGVEPGMVVHETRRGWRLGDELLRPAQVVVSATPESDDSWR